MTAHENPWTARERKLLDTLDTPLKIQAFLDRIAYSTEDRYRSPRTVMRERRAHCFDGALFAAAALRRLSFPPLLVDMFAERDDDHVLAVFKQRGHWGAIAKSNFVGLRYREPVYRSLRELVMSYFEDFYNVAGEKTLRSYTRPLNLRTLDRIHWMTDDAQLDAVADRLDALRRTPVITRAMVKQLARVDARSYRAGMLGVDCKGLYRLPK